MERWLRLFGKGEMQNKTIVRLLEPTGCLRQMKM